MTQQNITALIQSLENQYPDKYDTIHQEAVKAIVKTSESLQKIMQPLLNVFYEFARLNGYVQCEGDLWTHPKSGPLVKYKSDQIVNSMSNCIRNFLQSQDL